MGKSSAPSAPDPMQTAQAQLRTNIGSATAQRILNNTNSVGPFGSMRYGYTVDPSTGLPTFTQTTELSPQVRALLSRQMQNDSRRQGAYNPVIDAFFKDYYGQAAPASEITDLPASFGNPADNTGGAINLGGYLPGYGGGTGGGADNTGKRDNTTGGNSEGRDIGDRNGVRNGLDSSGGLDGPAGDKSAGFGMGGRMGDLGGLGGGESGGLGASDGSDSSGGLDGGAGDAGGMGMAGIEQYGMPVADPRSLPGNNPLITALMQSLSSYRQPQQNMASPQMLAQVMQQRYRS